MNSNNNQKDKELKNFLAYLNKQVRHVKSLYSFQQIKTWHSALTTIGYSVGEIEYIYDKQQLDSPITFPALNLLLDNFIYGQQEHYKEENKAHTATTKATDIVQRGNIQSEVEQCSNDSITNPGDISTGTTLELPREKREHAQNGVSVLSKTNPIQEELHKKTKSNAETIDDPLTSLLQSAKLFPFQSRAGRSLLNGIIKHHHRCQLLRAGVGTGKTFVFGAVLRQLEDTGFVNSSNCFSPWPICVITRASIVEKTKRELSTYFGLDTTNRVIVLNIEQLRAKFGEWMVEYKTTIIHGEEHIVWKWKEKFHPMIFVIDECQLAKNDYSTQAKIICALAELPEDAEVYILFVSATPFMRISEAKYFAVNTWKKI